MTAEQSVLEIQAALDAVSSPERWENDVSWFVAEEDNECWAIGPCHPVDGTADLAKADMAYILATQPLHMRKLLALIQSQKDEIGRLREALTPFVDYPADTLAMDADSAFTMTVRGFHLRNAIAALAPSTH